MSTNCDQASANLFVVGNQKAMVRARGIGRRTLHIRSRLSLSAGLFIRGKVSTAGAY